MLDAAHRGWGQGGDSGSHVGRKMQTRKTQRGLRADRSRRNDLLIIQAFGDTVGCIERLPCGVCGRNNLRCLRRGRSRSGCNHFLETCPATESNLSAWPAFFLKSSKPCPRARRLAPTGGGLHRPAVVQPCESSMHQNSRARFLPRTARPQLVPIWRRWAPQPRELRATHR